MLLDSSLKKTYDMYDFLETIFLLTGLQSTTLCYWLLKKRHNELRRKKIFNVKVQHTVRVRLS